ncbi:DUF829-domain-containing protein [Ophiobolus disseminans]|uniref:DUF829-domain-containing protein n=1 Tax=Ophiobolus disseminans TaxID=1469910 RepID=A0A6A6ZV58_9PLEO|nr:DUF829-domain-containing protein [Ophiobolus disseminans]
MMKRDAAMPSLTGFTLLAPSTYEYTPSTIYSPDYSAPKEIEAPSLVLLCTWTGAQNRHIAKYTSKYQSLFPSTRIMVIATTTKDLCFRNSRRKQERLRPAVERMSSLEYLLASNAGILLHVFSEGGSNKACELAEAYYIITGKRLPVSALCLDSTPGHPRYLRLCNALNKSLPQIPVLRHTGLFFGSAVLGAIWITYRFVKGKNNNVITRTRKRLLDLTHFDLTAPRCYLYSKEDALIAWQDVNEHAEESMQMGMSVNKVLFGGSGHVGHARKEPERYWSAVMATWRSTAVEMHGVTVVVEDLDGGDVDSFERGQRWSDADSQRTLLPGISVSGDLQKAC